MVGGIETRFVPGQSGNPRGRPPKRIHLPSMLQDKLDEPCKGDVALAAKEGRPVRTYLEVIADLLKKVAVKELHRKLRGDGTTGDILPAIKVLETAYGRAPKEVVHSGSVDHTGKVVHEHKVPALIAEFRGKLERIREAEEQRQRKMLTETTETTE